MGRAAHSTNSLPVHWSPPVAPDREASLADMLDWIDRQCPGSGAEALRHLRAAFPDSPDPATIPPGLERAPALVLGWPGSCFDRRRPT